MRILAFLVVRGAKVGRSFAPCHRVRNTLVPEYKDDAAIAVNVKRKIQKRRSRRRFNSLVKT